LFKKYFEELDQEKVFFIQKDINDLIKYETKLDEEIKGENVAFVPAVSAILRIRVPEAEIIAKALLGTSIDFSKDEFYADSEKREFPKTENDRKEIWRKRIKFLVLEKYYDLVESQEKNKSNKDFVLKSNEELEKTARERVFKLLEKYFDRYRSKVTEDEHFNMYVSLLTNTMDPHTDYLPPIEKRSFDEDMSGEYYGIGAALQNEDGNVKISSVMAGSPAWKSGEVTPGDYIIKVAQGTEEPIDIVNSGYTVTDAVKIIRGKKGTEVRLTLRKSDGSQRLVKLVREKIIQDEVYARSAIINSGKSKIGVITLPEFYSNFEDPNGRRCAEDVAKEIIKLKEEKTEGIIIDLRNNGGGSLSEVVKMVGLFVEEGPIVQVKDRDGSPSIYRDRDKSVLYDGPLAVMVNEFSASASEIFAAAIQDYGRGVIIGSTSTFGKGTVQRPIGLDRFFGLGSNNDELGFVKLTFQKFYRISGGSTQLKGVASDIVLPDLLEYYEYREKDQPTALPWDEIAKADYRGWKYVVDISTIKNNSLQRIASNNSFKVIKENTQFLAKQKDNPIPLKLEKFREEITKRSAISKQLDGINKLSKEMNIVLPKVDEVRWAAEKDKEERFIKPWLKNLKTDIYLDESVNIMNDMIGVFNTVYNKNVAQ
jgi:carboxyl-terminal processing protease